MFADLNDNSYEISLTGETRSDFDQNFLQNTRPKYDDQYALKQKNDSTQSLQYYTNGISAPDLEKNADFFAVVGNKRGFNLSGSMDRPVPTRLNPLYPVTTQPYKTTPFLGSVSIDRSYINTSNNLRTSPVQRQKQSEIVLGEMDYNRWMPNVLADTVQNAGKSVVGGVIQSPINVEDYTARNNVLFGNGLVHGHQIGISSRNIMKNYVESNKC